MYNSSFFKFMEDRIVIKAKCKGCKTWQKKIYTFKGKDGKRYCAACTPADTFAEHFCIQLHKLLTMRH